MRYFYYPGCTLETKAKGFNRATIESFAALGVELTTLPEWNCCGATFPLSVDNVLQLAGPARNLVSTAEAGGDTLVAACATCFNVLRRTNHTLRTNADVLDKLNAFLERPEPYAGQVEVRHILDILVHEVGLEAVAQRAQPGLKGLRAAAYYGCMLLRPADEIRLDDPERPHLMDDLLRALGAEVVEYPHGGECCGAYLSVTAPDVSMEMAHRILHSARRAGAQVIATACPLCQFNLDRPQNRMLQQYAGFQTLPVMYLTQLMALAFGLEGRGFDLDAHYIDPRPVLAQAGLLAPISTAMEEA